MKIKAIMGGWGGDSFELIPTSSLPAEVFFLLRTYRFWGEGPGALLSIPAILNTSQPCHLGATRVEVNSYHGMSLGSTVAGGKKKARLVSKVVVDIINNPSPRGRRKKILGVFLADPIGGCTHLSTPAKPCGESSEYAVRHIRCT